jgi:HK97 family phage prohead protease
MKPAKPLKSISEIERREGDFFRRPFELKSLDASGTFTGYAAVWDDVDQLDDVAVKGCFLQTISDWQARGTWPRILWQHLTTIGNTTDLAEDDYGLLTAGRIWYPDVVEEIRQAVQDAKADPAPAAGGGVGMSFAFVAQDFEMRGDIRYLTRVDLLDDITLTLRPVNTRAELLEIKSADGTIVEGRPIPQAKTVEGALRDAGCSRREAKAILSAGYSALRDADVPLPPAVAPSLAEIAKALQSI